MRVIRFFEKLNEETAIALGFFDGVHLAHQRVIEPVVKAKSKGLTPMVMTFETDSQTEIKGKSGLTVIETDRQKLFELERIGAEIVYMADFPSVAKLEWTEFVEEILIGKFNVKMISCGYDYRFGNGAKGNVELLRGLCEKHSVELNVVPQFKVGGETVSSTAIREYIKEGEIEKANRLLGYSYNTYSEVVHGRHLGNTLGFPTVNQEFSGNQLVPKYGVYNTTAYIRGVPYKSITNVGVKPTIKGERLPLAETYILGTDEDLYGELLRVDYHSLIREERRFSSIDELKNAIKSDVFKRANEE